MSRIFFAGGLRGWLQTVPAPGVAAAGPSPTPHRSTRLGAQPRPLRFRSRRHANKPASERPRPETSHLPPNRPRRQLRLVAHHAVRPHCEQANRANLAVQIWHLVALGRDPHSWPRARPHLRAAAGRPAGRWPHLLRRRLSPPASTEKRPHTPCCKKHAGCTMLPTTVSRFDVVKTRLQAGSASGTTMQVMRAVVRAEGWRALFSGWTAAVARAFPANAGLFAGVELASRLMGSSG